MLRRVFVLWLGISALSASVLAQSEPPFRIIVNAKNPTTAVDRRFVEEAFLKKITSWPNGDPIRPVDLPEGSPVRRVFTSEMLGRSIEEVRRYWQQRIFAGRDVPPLELGNEADVVKYVLEHEGSVGYVSPGANVGGARVLVVR